jgi:RHH-type rel operon transcriptional repressor/antitoxin RelB
MLAVRLSEDLEKKIERAAEYRQTTKTEIVKEALQHYFKQHASYNKPTPYELGQNLFGKYSSGKSDKSETYKKSLKDKIAKKIGR